MTTETEVEEVQTTEDIGEQEEVYDFASMSDDEVRNFKFPDEEVTTEEVTDEQETETEVKGSEVDPETNDETEEGDTETKDEQPKTGIVGRVVNVGGVDVTIESEEEALTLIQRGLGANRRMQELAPKIKMISTLEKQGLTDPDKLNFLIDLANGKPEALQKLISDKGIDTFDLSTGEVGDYQPEDYSISDSELAVSEAFDSISAEPTYSDTVATINGFDDKAKQTLTDNPSLIPELHTDMANGTYAEVMKIVAVDRAKGNLQGLGDFQAYQHVMKVVKEHSAGNRGTGEAGHNNSTNGQQAAGNLAGTEGTQEAGHKQAVDSNVGNQPLNAARQAAQSTTKARGVDSSATVIDFDKMTDEQIRNFDYSRL